METVLKLTAVMLLLLISIQDLRFYEVSWFLFPLVAIVFILNGILFRPYGGYFSAVGVNLLFFSSQLGAILAYVYLKERRLHHFFSRYFGPADVLMLLMLSLALSTLNCIIFYMGALMITLLYGLINRFFAAQAKVPLAGIFAFLLSGVIIASLSESFIKLHNDQFVLNQLRLWLK